MTTDEDQIISEGKRSELLRVALDCLAAVAADAQAPRNARLQAARSLLGALQATGQGVGHSRPAGELLAAPSSPAELATRLADVRRRKAAAQATAGQK